MKKVAATEAKNRLGALIDEAQREPIVIQRQERDVAVIVSIAEFERIRSANVRAFLEAQQTLSDEAKANGLTMKRLQSVLADED
ncbi:MAG: type II toxin-antitoxin system Phd/YefM family antitoxin [Cyanobacteria bacterium]|nr:type II toxin-antitoxin system Phd/YefM family antitoxin [Cyanobacteriota bacterium]